MAEKVIQFNYFQTCNLIFTAQKFRVQTTKNDVTKMVTYFIGRAIVARRQNKIQLSNKLIDYAAMICNIYQCTFQGAKKYRKAFNIKEYNE